MWCENLKTSIWHFDDGWRHELIYLICFWGDKFEILQHIKSSYYVTGKVKILYLALPYVCWEQRAIELSKTPQK